MTAIDLHVYTNIYPRIHKVRIDQPFFVANVTLICRYWLTICDANLSHFFAFVQRSKISYNLQVSLSVINESGHVRHTGSGLLRARSALCHLYLCTFLAPDSWGLNFRTVMARHATGYLQEPLRTSVGVCGPMLPRLNVTQPWG